MGLVKLWLSQEDQRAEALLDLGEIRPRSMGLSLSDKRLFALAGLDLISEKEKGDMAGIFASAEKNSGTVLTEVSALRNK